MQSGLDESIERLLNKTTSDVQSKNRARRFQQTVNDREDTEVFYNEDESKINEIFSMQRELNENINFNNVPVYNSNLFNKSMERTSFKTISNAKVDEKLQVSINQMKDIKQIQQEILIEVKHQRNEIQDIKTSLAISRESSHTNYISNCKYLGEKYDFQFPLFSLEDLEKFDDLLQKSIGFHNDVKNILHSCIDPSLVISKCIVNMFKICGY